ncbi:MAG: hypothetical protein ACI8PQ_003071, partial [Planctomycetota bacterium]
RQEIGAWLERISSTVAPRGSIHWGSASSHICYAVVAGEFQHTRA